MKRVLKYPIDPCDSSMMIPSEEILSVVAQGDTIVIYAEVDSEAAHMYEYDVQVFGTGHAITIDTGIYKFLGTAVMANGALMWHVYYRKVKNIPISG